MMEILITLFPLGLFIVGGALFFYIDRATSYRGRLGQWWPPKDERDMYREWNRLDKQIKELESVEKSARVLGSPDDVLKLTRIVKDKISRRSELYDTMAAISEIHKNPKRLEKIRAVIEKYEEK